MGTYWFLIFLAGLGGDGFAEVFKRPLAPTIGKCEIEGGGCYGGAHGETPGGYTRFI